MHRSWCNLDTRIASYYSVRLWLLRLGLHQLARPKIQADDWMWIVDHTMQLGERKCLILVAIRQSAWDADDRVLRREDVELIDLAAVGIAEHYVRHEGIHAKAAEELAAALPKPATPAARRLRKQLLEFVAAQGRQAREGERLLGSSEVLESIIGKFKNVAGERGQHGLTGMALSIGALVGDPAVETAQTAMTETTTQDVWNWRRLHLGPTVQSVRQRLRQSLCEEHKRKILRLESG